MSKVTRWPSLRLRRPAASTAEICTNTSLPPPSGEMKPKPLEVLKNFTVPVAIDFCPDHNVPAHATCVAGAKRASGEGRSGHFVQAHQATGIKTTGAPSY